MNIPTYTEAYKKNGRNAKDPFLEDVLWDKRNPKPGHIVFESTCADNTSEECDRLQKGARKVNYNRLVKLVKEQIPWLYDRLALNLNNPFDHQSTQTKTHYILVHSATDYFIRKPK